MTRGTWMILAAAAAAIAAAAAAGSAGLRASARAQLAAAIDAGSGPAVKLAASPGYRGTIPGRKPVHVPAGAHLGRHRMYRHWGTCSPSFPLTAAADHGWGWRFAPPAQGDL